MVAGFAEDLDSEDESTVPVTTNHINEDLDSRGVTRPPKKLPTTAVTVELTSSSEEDEKEDKNDEEEKRKERERREKENERTKAKKDKGVKSESANLKLEMPVDSSSGMVPAVDGIVLGTEEVDDWLNSPDTDPKVQLRLSYAIRGVTRLKDAARWDCITDTLTPRSKLIKLKSICDHRSCSNWLQEYE